MAIGAAVLLGGYLSDTSTPILPSGAAFAVCGFGPRINCVVDGDTFYLDGQTIRIADIDTPEIHPPRCAYEAELGERATRRLVELLNAGPFQLQSYASRDTDKYGRKLRVVVRDGQSLGGGPSVRRTSARLDRAAAALA